GDFQGARDAYRVFVHGLRRHIAFEEGVLFPEFEARTGQSPAAGPTAVMRFEHREIESLLARIEAGIGDPATAVDAARAQMHRILGDHNVKEERVLYPGTDDLLSAAERDELVRRIQAFGG
ncbi:MAG TPA: hemerythrin domain-containing protein, partial [Vicinamibacteria bacterium]|nr:hemerythrin domain-containing protein [Vicinamibacteria bacterium]